MNWIYRLNWWYDDLDEKHGVLRFFLFLIPWVACSVLVQSSTNWACLLGAFGMAVMATVRIYPFVFKRKRP